jgi:hypothetical protein
MLDAMLPLARPWILHSEWPPREESFVASPSFKIFSYLGSNATMWTQDIETSKVADLQEALHPWVIHREYRVSVRKVKPKPRHRHEAPVLVEKLKGFVCIILCPRPLTDGLVVQICYYYEHDEA